LASLSRVLAVDFGERRLGVALSDPTRTIASPLTTLPRRAGKRPPWPALERLVQENEVTALVVGLPLDLRGDETAWTAEVRAFAAQLGRRTGLPVHFVDERMSSVQAERAVRGSGLPRSRREEKERIDAAAASIILQRFLERKRDASDADRS
jgi:putative holliday junction resolvase